MEKQFEEFAKKINGKYLGVDLLKSRPYPEVEATVDGVPVHLKLSVMAAANGKVLRHITSMTSGYGGDPFEFSVRGGYWNNPADKLLSILKKDIKVGSSNFDEHFMVHSSDRERIKAVFDDPTRKLLLDLDDVWFEMSHNGVQHEVAFFDVGITVDVQRLVDIAQAVVMTRNGVAKSVAEVGTA